MGKLFDELKRRKVFRVALVYAVVAWLLIQIVGAIANPLSLPDWFDTAVIVLLGIGFPIAIILAWAYEVTPDGIRADSPNQFSGSGAATPASSQKADLCNFRPRASGRRVPDCRPLPRTFPTQCC